MPQKKKKKRKKKKKCPILELIKKKLLKTLDALPLTDQSSCKRRPDTTVLASNSMKHTFESPRSDKKNNF